jgi:glyoxylase-like metal-dependent hydrolase (beta-lactamase superfamily II)
MTHLHQDHVGWNTLREGDRWEPTFPNARYHFPRLEFDLLNEKWRAGDESIAGGSFADSVMPVVDAGLASFVDAGAELFGLLGVEAAYGHSPGMLNYRLRDGGEEGVFCTDIFHSPIQILEPALNTAFCQIPDQALATRAAFLERASSSGCLVMPSHFGNPYAGYIRRSASGYAFEPAELRAA